MSIFKKKKEEPMAMCECGNMCRVSDIEAKKALKEKQNNTDAKVKILGSGCAKCNQLEANTVEALKALGMETAVDHVTDFSKIAQYGVMSTPALVYDGKVLSYGKVLTVSEASELLKKAVQ